MEWSEKRRKKITVASVISGSGLIKAGGSNVVHGLYTRLAQFYDIEIIYLAPANEEYRKYEIVPGLMEVVIPKTQEHIEAERKITNRLKAQTTYDISLMYLLEKTPKYGNVLKYSISNSDVVFIERPYLFYEVRKYLNGRPLFQRSQNIEYYFRKSNIPESEETTKMLEDLFKQEKVCCECSKINFSCSEEDLKIMHNMYGIPNEKLRLLSNGVACEDNPFVSIEERMKIKKRYGLSKEKIAIFIGGGHKPNMEACDMILQIAPFCKDTKFIFAGNVCNELSKMKRPENTALLGLITEETRRFLFSVADVALNPMYSGSGSNIKMFDYMAMGIPIISTKFGARGISDISTFHLADTAEELITTINNFSCLGESEAVRKARRLIEEQYDWKVLADGVRETIEQFTN